MALKIVVLAKQVPDTRNVGKDAMTAEGTKSSVRDFIVAQIQAGCSPTVCLPVLIPLQPPTH